MAAPATRIYWDTNADAPVHPRALEAYVRAARVYSSPDTRHAPGREAKALIDEATTRAARCLGVSAGALHWTSGGTESDALVSLGVAGGLAQGALIVTSTLEHPAVVKNLERLAAERGLRIERIAAGRDGGVRVEDFVRVLDSHRNQAGPGAAAFVSCVLVCNETGVVQPIADLARVCRARGVLLHTDAAQAPGRIALDLGALGADYASLSAHKCGGLAGVGLVYARAGALGAVQNSLFSVPPALAESFAAALEALPDEAERARLASTRDSFEAALIERLGRATRAKEGTPTSTSTSIGPDTATGTAAVRQVGALELVGATSPRAVNTSCVRFAGIAGEAVVMALDLEGVAVSAGSACSSGSVEASPVLMGMGMSPAEAREAVRFSLPLGTTRADVERVAQATVEVVQRAVRLGGIA